MKKKFNISFKKQKKETGLSAIGFPDPNSVIKVNKKEVGEILAPNYTSKENVWKISFYVADPEFPEHHTTKTLQKTFESDAAAREWCKEHLEKLDKMYTLKSIDDD